VKPHLNKQVRHDGIHLYPSYAGDAGRRIAVPVQLWAKIEDHIWKNN
jgi:hypothetical protein